MARRGADGPAAVLIRSRSSPARWSAAPGLPPAAARAARRRRGGDDADAQLRRLGLASWLVNTLLLARHGNSASPPIATRAELPGIGGATLTWAAVALAALAVYALWGARQRAAASSCGSPGSTRRSRARRHDGAAGDRRRDGCCRALVGGLGGAVHALGVVHRFVEGFSPGYGFTGIAIALLARNGAIGIVLASILFGALSSAGATMQLFSDMPSRSSTSCRARS